MVECCCGTFFLWLAKKARRWWMPTTKEVPAPTPPPPPLPVPVGDQAPSREEVKEIKHLAAPVVQTRSKPISIPCSSQSRLLLTTRRMAKPPHSPSICSQRRKELPKELPVPVPVPMPMPMPVGAGEKALLFQKGVGFPPPRCSNVDGIGILCSAKGEKLISSQLGNGAEGKKMIEKRERRSSQISGRPTTTMMHSSTIGAGLCNLGNTCYLNSVLQCLTYTEPLAVYLQSSRHTSSCCMDGFCSMCALENHVKIARESSGKILSPLDFVNNLTYISADFQKYMQEDAHEYMINLLEHMHRCCFPVGFSWESPSAYENSIVHQLFGGHLQSQVMCMDCHNCSNKFEQFIDLSVEINKVHTVQDAILDFTASEELDGGQRHYWCHSCEQKVRAKKQLTVHKAPRILTIHLKRFGIGIDGQKINKKVKYETTLDLRPFMSDHKDEDLTYTLYGVLVHKGPSTQSGHYYCFVCTFSGIWYLLNDHQVSQVSEEVVFDQDAYVLFYSRI